MEEARVRRLEEAGEWLLRLKSGYPSEEDIAEWLRWCDESPHNVDAFESMQRDWRDLNALKTTKNEAEARRSNPAPHRRSPRIRWSLAAGIVLAIIAASFYWTHVTEQTQEVVAATDNELATLPDGSSVVLGARTQVTVDFSALRRQIDLSLGEAYFKVQRDPRRPFVVRVGEVSVTAVGTAFDVRREEDRVIVTVEEGVVDVASAATSGDTSPETWRAGPGYQVAYSNRHRTATIAAVNPAAVLRWREGELAYVWEPLGSVIEDVNRYSSRRIRLGDAGLAELRFTGTVFTASIDDWLKAVEAAYPVRVEAAPNGDLVLHHTEKGAALVQP